MRKLAVLVTLIILGQFSFSNALNVETHKAINKYIISNNLNNFSLDTYLKNNVGIQGGVSDKFNTHLVWEWIRDGGEYEDKPPWTLPYIRSVNHFHNPITEEGFSGFFYGLLLSGDSSIVWAQKPAGTQSPISDYTLGGNYSWHDSRDYFYTALKSTIRTQRDTYFAKTFRGIGQIMHLVEDASIPDHTRNDGHLAGYEKWVEKNVTNLNGITPISYNTAILDRPTSGLPIANLIDTNQYVGSNPEITIGNAIGLAEFTNANFFSDDTVFKNFPHPAKENATALLVEQYAKDGNLDETWYIQGYTSQRLAAYSYFWKNGLPPTAEWLFHLDDFVYGDYADQLIPRAVGYSAGLLNYFFRGNITISIPDTGIYAQTDDPNQGFTSITILAENTTSTGEEMTDGSIELVVRYKLTQEDPFQTSPVATDTEFTYVTVPEANNANSISRGSATELTFGTGQSTIIPLWATDVYLQVVYRGRLGNEDGAVAVGFKDISEPTPVDLYNNMAYAFMVTGMRREALRR